MAINKILVTGGTGMVGSSFNNLNFDYEFILVGSKQYNLIDRAQVDNMIKDIKPDAIIHLAAKVGGVVGNTTYVNDFFNKNEIVTYRDHSDLSEKIIKYNKDDKSRKNIAENGRKKYFK